MSVGILEVLASELCLWSSYPSGIDLGSYRALKAWITTACETWILNWGFVSFLRQWQKGTYQLVGFTKTAGSWRWAHKEERPDGAVLLVPAIHILDLFRACYFSNKHACAVTWLGGLCLAKWRTDPERLLWGIAKSLPLFPLSGKVVHTFTTGINSAPADFSETWGCSGWGT